MGKVSFQLTIPNGSTVSNALTRSQLRHNKSLSIQPPASFGTGGVQQVEVTDKIEPVTADWKDLQSGGSDVVLTVDKAVVLTHIPFMGLRIRAAADPGTDLVYDITLMD